MEVSWLAKEKSGFSEEEILNRYKNALIGFDGSFTLKNQLFAIDKTKTDNVIIWLGTVPIEWYKEDLKLEKEQRERKEARERERLRRLLRRPEGTTTERRRSDISSNLLSRG